MNPIALRHNRRIYAYACGRCGTTFASDARLGFDPAQTDERIRRNAKRSKAYANQCCACDECGAELDGKTFGCCDPCEAKNQAKHREDIAKAEARVVARDAYNEAAIQRAGGDEEAAHELLFAMEQTNESNYYGGWPIGAEFTLWGEAHNPGEIDEREADNMAQLAKRACGWWAWSAKFDDPVFVPMAEWLAMVETRRASGG